MESTLTLHQRNAIATFLIGKHIPRGLGTKEEACSIASINLALNGKLQDTIPDCMSLVVGKWIIGVQDAMPDLMRNSSEWRALLPRAAGTGRDSIKEGLRLELIMNWMWDIVLPSVQPVANKYGFGPQWKVMCTARTAAANAAAANAAANAYYAANAAAANAHYVANAAANAAASAADDAATAARYAAAAADSHYAANAAADAANAAADAADDAANAAAANAHYVAWQQFNPVSVLRRLIEVEPDFTEADTNAIEVLRSKDYAVVIFTAEELQGANPSRVQDRLVELGWDVINDLK